MASPTPELMRRVTLTITLDQGLLEVEAKSQSSGRLFNGDARGAKAANLLAVLAAKLDPCIRSKSAVSLNVDADNFEISPSQ